MTGCRARNDRVFANGGDRTPPFAKRKGARNERSDVSGGCPGGVVAAGNPLTRRKGWNLMRDGEIDTPFLPHDRQYRNDQCSDGNHGSNGPNDLPSASLRNLRVLLREPSVHLTN